MGLLTAEGIVTRPIPPSVVSYYQPNKIDQLFYLSRKIVSLDRVMNRYLHRLIGSNSINDIKDFGSPLRDRDV